MPHRPADRIVVLEFPVLRIGAVDAETDVQGARGQVALRSDIVAGEDVDGRRGDGGDARSRRGRGRCRSRRCMTVRCAGRRSAEPRGMLSHRMYSSPRRK